MSSLLSYALTSVADVKESMGIASSEHSWDNIITRKINQATRQIEAYTGRHFVDTTYTNEEYNSTQGNQLILKQRPITATTTLSLGVRDNGLNVSSWETVDAQLYFVDNNSGVVDLLFNAVGKWNRWRLTYSAGYATIPEDLAEACATLAAYYAANADGQVQVREKQEGSRRIMYYPGIRNLDDLMGELGIDQIINSYTNMPVLTDR